MSDDALVAYVHELDKEISYRQRLMLDALAELDERERWLDDGAHDMAHWIGMQLGVSRWKAERWVASGHALRKLPAVAQAFSSGELGIDKVVELTRLASPEDEDELVVWASETPSGAIRRRAELQAHDALARNGAERSRWLEWRYLGEGTRMRLDAELPSSQGAVIVSALDRVAASMPSMPDENPAYNLHERRADALVALCSSRLASDLDQDRATVVVHADLDGLLDGRPTAAIEGGGVIGPDGLERLLCNARIQTVVENRDGSVHSIGPATRDPSASMMRQLRYRDDTCRFPGCDARRFTQAHHIEWWSKGGKTELENLLLLCRFHHVLVHDDGWSVSRTDDGEIRWSRPSGVRYRAGPRVA
jgi:hypothetical protein